MVQSLYGQWLARNRTREGKRIAAPLAIAISVTSFMEEWRSIQELRVKTPIPTPVERWLLPVEGWLKANADGATSKMAEKSGGGVVLRDHNGAFRAAACHYSPSSSDSELLEILACRRAVQLAMKMGMVVELDSKAW